MFCSKSIVVFDNVYILYSMNYYHSFRHSLYRLTAAGPGQASPANQLPVNLNARVEVAHALLFVLACAGKHAHYSPVLTASVCLCLCVCERSWEYRMRNVRVYECVQALSLGNVRAWAIRCRIRKADRNDRRWCARHRKWSAPNCDNWTELNDASLMWRYQRVIWIVRCDLPKPKRIIMCIRFGFTPRYS